MASLRKCKNCEQIKSVEEFGRIINGRDGRRAQCLSCDKKYQREYRLKRKKMPRLDEEYQLTERTMRDHFYIHFGFRDEYKENWRIEYTKYYQKPLIDKYNEIKKNK